MGSLGRLRALPAAIWTLGFGSLLMDTSSELIHSLLPVFMASVLGASMSSIGLIEGLAEGATAVTKVFSGAWSDRLRGRKALVVLGYALAALSKLAFPLATSLSTVLLARLTDRIGKGIREAPRDALIADVTPTRQRGAAYGLRQALDSVGAFLGPALAILLMALFAGNLKAVFWVALLPAGMAVMVLVVGIREPRRERPAAGSSAPPTLSGMKSLGGPYWAVLALGATFALARFSDAFLVLRARSVGVPAAYVPIVMIAMNVVYAASAYPAGSASDRIGRRPLLFAGFTTLAVADTILASAATAWLVLLGAALWGLQMALTQGLMSKLIAARAPVRLQGTAFGIFYLASGVATIAGSAIAGTLWDRLGPSVTFMTGALFAIVCAAGVLLQRQIP